MRRLVALAVLVATAPALAAQERPTGPLAAALGPLLQGPPWGNATWGALVVSLTRGDTLLSFHADHDFLPASNAKLFTTAAALHYLGPQYSFATTLYAAGEVRDGTLYGDLVLYGTGDPSFALDTADLAPFADSVVSAGILRVTGAVVGDASYLGPERIAPGWTADNLDQPYAAPPAALGAAGNVVHLTVRPGPRPGSRARVAMDPPNRYFTVRNHVTTGPRRSRTRISLQRDRSGRVLTLSGALSGSRRAWSADLVVPEPARFAAGLLGDLLTARGVTVDGATRVVDDDAAPTAGSPAGTDDDPAPSLLLAVRASPSLGELLAAMNQRSDNLAAELIFRTIGRMVVGTGSYASGAHAVSRFLADAAGIAPGTVTVTDGSGLSVRTRATPRSLVHLLAYERRTSLGGSFWRALPTAGAELDGRMAGTAAEGRVRAKTGTLKNASALSGYVSAVGGEVLAFSVIVNGTWRIAQAREVQDEIGVRLARFYR
jgi:D-alanyl-D-alanine carboxypeptidase/D-alanyl-D-alanine-endopeptidase (penicillin-binding protein 4)